MIFFAIITSLLLTLLNIYLVVKIWQLKKVMTVIASDLIYYESSLKFLLANTTQTLNQQQVKIQQVRQEYQILLLKWQKTKQLLILLSWLYRIVNKYVRADKS